MDKTEVQKEFKERFLELREILNSWELIPGSPKDEFDGLNHQILSHLYKGSDKGKITRVLDSELTVTYGLSVDIADATEIASDIIDWWNSTDRPIS